MDVTQLPVMEIVPNKALSLSLSLSLSVASHAVPGTRTGTPGVTLYPVPVWGTGRIPGGYSCRQEFWRRLALISASVPP